MARSVKEWMRNDLFQEAYSIMRSKRNRLWKAEECLRTLLERYPKDPAVLVAKGNLAAHQTMLLEARDIYRHAQALADPKEYSSPWLNEANLYEKFGIFRRATRLATHVLHANANDVNARALHARCSEKRRRLAETWDLTREDPVSGDPFVLDTLELLLAMNIQVLEVKGRVKDHVGLAREVDILAEYPAYKFLGPLALVIECKDWSRPVGRAVIDKCLALTDHSKYKLCVVVCRSFSRDAEKLAKASGIWLISKDDLEATVAEILLAGPHIRRDLEYLAALPHSRGPVDKEERQKIAQRVKAEAEALARAKERLLFCLNNPRLSDQAQVKVSPSMICVDETTVISHPFPPGWRFDQAFHTVKDAPLFVKLIYFMHLPGAAALTQARPGLSLLH